jgi:hypothetical protein
VSQHPRPSPLCHILARVLIHKSGSRYPILGILDLPKGSFFTAYVSSSSVVHADGVMDVVTPDFLKKTKCISYVRQDQVYTYIIDVMSEISINSNKNVQELNHYIISLLH